MFQETTTRNHNSQSPKQTRQSRKENKKVQNCLRNSITISSPLIASGIVPETFTLSPKSGPQENQVPPSTYSTTQPQLEIDLREKTLELGR